MARHANDVRTVGYNWLPIIDERRHPLFPDLDDVTDHFQVSALMGLLKVAI